MSLAVWTTGLAGLLVALPLILLGGAILVRAGVRLRRRFPAFSPRSLRVAPRGSLTRKIIVGFYAVTAAEWLSIVLIGGVCSALDLTDLIWPLIGLVVSLHFLPLGWLFGVRPYYVLGVVGTVIALAAILEFTGALRVTMVGLGLGLLMFSGATYLVTNAESLAKAYASSPP